MPSGGRNVASVAYSQVEEISGASALHTDANFNFQGFTDWMQSRQPEQPLPPANPTSNFDTNSTTFLHLLSQQQRDLSAGDQGDNKSAPGYHQRVTKAIRAYEDTAITIGGGLAHKGSSVSLTL